MAKVDLRFVLLLVSSPVIWSPLAGALQKRPAPRPRSQSSFRTRERGPRVFATSDVWPAPWFVQSGER
jgi:hypothetical protein